jgi:hypothetical protein
MRLVYSNHALRRMKQRGITSLEIEFIILHAYCVKKRFDGRKELIGLLDNRNIKIIFVQKENYINIITVI